LSRILDKWRATLAGKQGEYKYNCPLDQRFFEFVGIDATALKKQLDAGKSDGEILDWVRNHARNQRTDLEITAWSEFMERRVPGDPESRSFFNELQKKVAPNREDITTWFDLLDVDDYASFGGKV